MFLILLIILDLVHCTNEPNVSIPSLANLLIERSQNASWVVVFKALITTHHLLAYGNERFIQYLASSNSSFNLGNFLDKGGVQGYDMSPFIRRYAKYLNEKSLSYRANAFDFCKIKRGKEEGSLRVMNTDKLLKTLPVLQQQLDALLEFDCTANDLTNGVINMCFMLLFRDLIRLFACYNDAIINLLEKYFDMNKKQCRDALDLYKKFLTRMDRVGEFLKVAENIGIDKGDIPDLTKAPSSLLDALEQHLNALEGKKTSAANTPTQTASNQKNVKSGVSALSSTSSSFGTAAASAKFDSHTNGIDESTKAQALAEEEAAMSQYKSKVGSPSAATNPFLASPPASSGNIVDLFGPADGAQQAAAQPTNALDDLLQLGNPFADMFGAPAPVQQQQPVNNQWMSNGFNGISQVVAAPPTAHLHNNNHNNSSAFVSESNFSSVFGNSEPVAKPYYYMQAAGKEDNPFLTDDVNQTGALAGEMSSRNDSRIARPVRPPPPKGNGNNLLSSSLTSSPARAQKSAFDDLHESMGKAFTASPSKSIPFSSGGFAVDQREMQVAGLFSNSSQPPIPQQQNIFAPSQMFSSSSPVQGQNFVSSSIIGGGFDPLGEVLKPASSIISGQSSTTTTSTTGFTQQTIIPGTTQQQQQPGKVLTGDLDSSLASLAENLTINKSATSSMKGVQWNSPKNQAKPQNWSPQPMAATTGANYRPMAKGMTVTPAPSTIHMYSHNTLPTIAYFPMQQQMPGQPQMRPMMAPAGMPMQGIPAQPQQQPIIQQQMPQVQPANTNIQLDPFGA
ncbi:hypothetical protein PVAND_010884 [Polypedilum vanderplanki]|uniref:ENTH domain-containing protein n=1 Tax=Polypedilum vanderplanki TaxID=319348 RepID=A0A9J6CGX9_POLVA|nr:hypothetical protein PVAND_010884 [Polypedilum vanderplanki]